MDDPNQEPIPNPNAPDYPPSTPPPASPNPPSDAPAPVYRDWREQRLAERQARREARWQRRGGRHSGWIGGAILILIGVVFLLQNMGIPFLTNWWALLILIPAYWAFVAGWDSYQEHGRLTRGGAGALAFGLLLTIVAVVFLFGLEFGLFWPILLIVGGLILLGTAFLPA